MPRLIALFKQPEDPQAFDAHYRDVHEPIVRSYPKLQRYSTCRPQGVGGRTSPYYLMAEMTFASDQDLTDALGSEPAIASARDLRNFAGAGVSLFVAPDADSPEADA